MKTSPKTHKLFVDSIPLWVSPRSNTYGVSSRDLHQNSSINHEENPYQNSCSKSKRLSLWKNHLWWSSSNSHHDDIHHRDPKKIRGWPNYTPVVILTHKINSLILTPGRLLLESRGLKTKCSWQAPEQLPCWTRESTSQASRRKTPNMKITEPSMRVPCIWNIKFIFELMTGSTLWVPCIWTP